MDPILFLRTQWLGVTLIVLAILCVGVALIRRRMSHSGLGWFVLAGMLICLGLGGMFLAGTKLSIWFIGGSVTVLFGMFIVLILSTNWSTPAAYGALALGIVGVGGILLDPLADYLYDHGSRLANSRFLQPWWLLLLLVLPLIVLLSVRSLSGLGTARRAMAILLRCLAVSFVILALAEMQTPSTSSRLTVLFLWDKSASIPQVDTGAGTIDERIRGFIKDAVVERPSRNAKDEVGLIVFGRWARLELSPESVQTLNLPKKPRSKYDPYYTNISASLKLALASFSGESGKRAVIFSDGNENLGNALAQARIAKQNGMQIDVVMLDTNNLNQQEVLIERIEPPVGTRPDQKLPLRVILRNQTKEPVIGDLRVFKGNEDITDQLEEAPRGNFQKVKIKVDGKEKTVTKLVLQPNWNIVEYTVPGVKKGDSVRYNAKFYPDNLRADTPENNKASTIIIAQGEKKVLFVEEHKDEHAFLIKRLLNSDSGLKVTPITVTELPLDTKELGVYLSKFDTVVLADIPADRLNEAQQKIIRSNTKDQGCGLVVIGGPDSFGAGGWQNQELEKAWPVICDLKSLKVDAKGGLVLIMHASELSSGNTLQKQIARAAVDRLTYVDMVGLLYYSWRSGSHIWHVQFQQLKDKATKNAIISKFNSMSPGDMPDAEPSLLKAYEALNDPRHNLAKRLIIFISDGDHWRPPLATLAKIKKAKIPISTVCITTHGRAERTRMKKLADETGGRYYEPRREDELEAIYIKEARLVSQSFIYNKTFNPIRTVNPNTSGIPDKVLEKLDKKQLPLHGFVRTSKRQDPLVEVLVKTKKINGFEFPIIARWQHGLGRVVVFTSDAQSKENDSKHWDRDWAKSEVYTPFWTKMIDWSLRSVVGNQKLNLLPLRFENGKVRIAVDARGDDDRPLTDLKFKVGITTPVGAEKEFQPKDIEFRQTNSGYYEAAIDAEDVGSYLINIQAYRQLAPKEPGGKVRTEDVGAIRAGIDVPYSPEFRTLNSNIGLLKRLAEETGGRVYSSDDEDLRKLAEDGELFRAVPLSDLSQQPVWFWLVLLAGLCFLGDVAARRIALEPAKWFAPVYHLWLRLRGHSYVQPSVPMGRLQTRKAQMSQDWERTSRKYESEGEPVGDISGPMDLRDPTAQPKTTGPSSAPKMAPQQEQSSEPQDFASRLKRAKKRVWEERDKKDKE